MPFCHACVYHNVSVVILFSACLHSSFPFLIQLPARYGGCSPHQASPASHPPPGMPCKGARSSSSTKGHLPSRLEALGLSTELHLIFCCEILHPLPASNPSPLTCSGYHLSLDGAPPRSSFVRKSGQTEANHWDLIRVESDCLQQKTHLSFTLRASGGYFWVSRGKKHRGLKFRSGAGSAVSSRSPVQSVSQPASSVLIPTSSLCSGRKGPSLLLAIYVLLSERGRRNLSATDFGVHVTGTFM